MRIKNSIALLSKKYGSLVCFGKAYALLAFSISGFHRRFFYDRLGLHLITPIVSFGVFYWLWNFARYPHIGNDIGIWIPYFITGKWHFAHMGLLPFLFSPHLCGGVPVYANTHDFYYSTLQLIALFSDPWLAIQITTAMAFFLGYFGWYLLGKKILHITSSWSHALATIIMLNGFYLMHIGVSHLWCITMLLLGCIAFLLLDNSPVSMTEFFVRLALFIILIAAIIHMAGFLTLFFAAIAFSLSFPAYMLLISFQRDPAPYFRAFIRFICFGLAGIAAAASKLVFFYSFLSVYPRTTGIPVFHGDHFSALLHSMFWPLLQYGHEYSVYTSPVIIIGLLSIVLLLLELRHFSLFQTVKILLIALNVILSSIFLIQLTAGKGLLVDDLLHAPVFSSMREPFRFVFILNVYLAIISIWSLAVVTRMYCKKYSNHFATTTIALTVIFFFAASFPLIHSLGINHNNHEILKWWYSLHAQKFYEMPVSVVQKDTDYVGTSGIYCSDSLLGWAQDPQSAVLQTGDVFLSEDGYYNLINPICYLAPQVNNCLPASRFPIEDHNRLEAFRTGRPLHWHFTTMQRMSSYATLLIILFAVVILLWTCTSKMYYKNIHPNIH